VGRVKKLSGLQIVPVPQMPLGQEANHRFTRQEMQGLFRGTVRSLNIPVMDEINTEDRFPD